MLPPPPPDQAIEHKYTKVKHILGDKLNLPTWANITTSWEMHLNWEDARAFICPPGMLKQGIVISSLFKKAAFLSKFKEPIPEKTIAEESTGDEASTGAASSSSAPGPANSQKSTPTLVRKANLRSPLLKKLRTG